MTAEPRPHAGSRPPARAVYCKPTIAQVLAATRSLYEDELRPFGRILLKRIRERAAQQALAAAGLPPAPVPDVSDVPLIDPRCLRKMCEGCPVFQVQPAEGREYAVTLAARNGVFVDPCSARDPYPGQLWREAGAYFEGLSEEDGKLPSGRYACAQVIKARDLPFFRGKSLGEICHIVQLAISQKKILGYSDSHLVPYSRSDECVKESCALRQLPVSNPYEAELPFASWDDVCHGMKVVLETSTNPGPGMVTLSNVKRLFRAQLGLELSETVLGHSRVGELLQDPRLSHVCTLRSVGNGQAIVQLAQSAMCGWGSYGGAMAPSQQAYYAPHQPGPVFQGTAAAYDAGPVAAAAEPAQDPTCLMWSSCASNRQPTLQQMTLVPVSILVPPEEGSEEGAPWIPTTVMCLQGVLPDFITGQATDAAPASVAGGDAGGGTGGDVDGKAQGSDHASDELETRSVHSSNSGGCYSNFSANTAVEAVEDQASPPAMSRVGLVVRNTFLDVSRQGKQPQAERRASSVPRSSSSR